MNLKELKIKRIEIIKRICENQNICKLLYHTEDNPLELSEVINPFETLFMNKLFPLPFIPNINNTTGATLNVFFGEIKKDGLQFKDIEIKLIVCCHIDSWLISGEDLRPDAICEELEDVLENIEGLGLNKPQMNVRRPPIRFAENHYGYELSFRLTEHR